MDPFSSQLCAQSPDSEHPKNITPHLFPPPAQPCLWGALAPPLSSPAFAQVPNNSRCDGDVGWSNHPIWCPPIGTNGPVESGLLGLASPPPRCYPGLVQGGCATCWR